MIAGMQLLLTEARGPGQIAFSRDGTGHVFPLHLRPGSAVEVREHQYLAATGNLEYGFTRQKGIRNMLFGSTGFFVDRFAAAESEGVVWLHGYGNVFEKVLAPGEQIDVETEVGFTATRVCGWKRRFTGFAPECSAEPAISSSTASPAPVVSAFSRCTLICPPTRTDNPVRKGAALGGALGLGRVIGDALT